MGVQKTNMQMLFTEKIEHRLGYTFYNLLLKFAKQMNLRLQCIVGNCVVFFFAWRTLISDY